jgi:hypothetical protein
MGENTDSIENIPIAVTTGSLFCVSEGQISMRIGGNALRFYRPAVQSEDVTKEVSLDETSQVIL